jgi:RND family efflux transporter MFP subunit
VKNRKVIIAIVVLVVLAAIVGAVVFAQGSSGPTVKTAKVVSEPLAVTVTASGKITADRKSDVYPPTQATLSEVRVVDGQPVKAGQVIAVIDTDPLEIQIAQARAGIAAANAQYQGAVQQEPTAADRAAANANVTYTQSVYNNANNVYQSFLKYYRSAPATVQPSLEASLTQLRIAKEQTYAGYLGAVSQRVKLSRTMGLSAQKTAADAAENQSAAALMAAQKQYDQAQLVAPFDGVVVFNAVGAPAGAGAAAPQAGVGSAVSPASAPFTVYALDSTYFSAEVDETDIEKVREGLGADVSLDAFPGDTFTSKVRRIMPVATLTTSGGTAFPVLIPVDLTKKTVRIGMQGNADIKVSEITDALTIPIDALFDEGGKSYVYVVQTGGKLKKTEVVAGTLTDTRAQIKKGVSAGETVALAGTTKLTDGLTVKVE